MGLFPSAQGGSVVPSAQIRLAPSAHPGRVILLPSAHSGLPPSAHNDFILIHVRGLEPSAHAGRFPSAHVGLLS